MNDQRAALGAYGLRLAGAAGAEEALVAAPDHWPLVRLQITTGPDDGGSEHLDDRLAHIRLRTGGYIDIDRDRGLAAFTVPSPLSADELVHPYLAPVAAVTSFWYGRESFHAGGLAVGDIAWAILGDRHSGKSSTLAALAQRGVDVVCDDVLVVEELEAFAGPRTVDLREDAAAALGTGEGIGLAGARERWRMPLRPLDRRLTLGGWVFTAWADETALVPLPASEALARLLRHRAITVPPAHPAAFVSFAALPAWELRRPRSWEALPEALELLVEGLAGWDAEVRTHEADDSGDRRRGHLPRAAEDM